MSITTAQSAYPVSYTKAKAVGDLLVSTVKASPLLYTNFYLDQGFYTQHQPQAAKITYDYWHNSSFRKGVRRLRIRVWLAPGITPSSITAPEFEHLVPTTSELLEFHTLLARLELITLENLKLENCRLIYSPQQLWHHYDICWSFTIFYKSHKYTKSER